MVMRLFSSILFVDELRFLLGKILGLICAISQELVKITTEEGTTSGHLSLSVECTNTSKTGDLFTSITMQNTAVTAYEFTSVTFVEMNE